MIEINLIPDVKRELLKAQRARAVVISTSIIASIIAGSVLVLLLLYIGVQGVRGNLLDGKIDSGSTKLAQVEDLSKILTIQNQLVKISSLNGEKNITSRMFDMLSAVTPGGDNKVQFSSVDITEDGKTVRLEGQTRGYDSMEVFKKTVGSAVIAYTTPALEDGTPGEQKTVPLAADISTSDVSYGEDSTGKKVLRFTLSFTYDDALFATTTISPTFKLSVNGNVTDSYLGIPKSLFTERAKDL